MYNYDRAKKSQRIEEKATRIRNLVFKTMMYGNAIFTRTNSLSHVLIYKVS